ncbi:threonine aldolase family protein [Bordetella genomosp. 13]|uniref:threonine aldolase family protein n=1 Tax=Bordetella genomosp. 13 TaxID=463040 RepID=UPI0011A6DFF8|nr:GntG family PLP-dependent aldolase [Bordetella genomosp. 13]
MDHDTKASNPRTETIDLRSDTVTLPTAQMYEAIAVARLGDDGLDGDPTAQELEAGMAGMLGKEAGVYFPSCTMANLATILVQAGRQDIVLAQEDSHIYGAERGGAALTGAFYHPIRGENGAMDLGLLSDALASKRSKLRTALVCLENSHNSAGGTVLPVQYMKDVAALAREAGAAVHLDGARVFNAAVHLGVPVSALAAHTDTVAVCLSKGLGAPMGAVLVCPQALAGSIRNMRRALGGGQRQVGIAAAAGLVAIRTMVARLADDHATAARLSTQLRELAPALRVSVPQTNIVMVDTSATGRSAQQWVSQLGQGGVLVRPWSEHVLRCVTHRHIGQADVDRAAQVFAAQAGQGR